jgi:hypothetical protein
LDFLFKPQRPNQLWAFLRRTLHPNLLITMSASRSMIDIDM